MRCVKVLGRISSLLVLMAFAACSDRNALLDRNAEIPNAHWAVNDEALFELQVTDTVSQHNFFINVRNTEAYAYRNLYVFLTTTFPNGKSARDTIGLMLADPMGRWYGQGSGYLSSKRYHSNAIMYQYNRRFPIEGNYTFSIQQAMRTDTLGGILNIGMRIEKQEGA